METEIISIGFDKDWEAYFSISANVEQLSYNDINRLRAMITVAIGTMEGMWRRHQELINPPSQTNSKDNE